MTCRAALTGCERELLSVGVPEPKSDAWLLFSDVTGMDKNAFYLREKEELEEEKEKKLIRLTEERKKRIPVQYLTGRADFFGLTFEVNRNVLIPRMDTEILVEEILKSLGPEQSLLELCTGSGCIAVSVKKNRPDVSVTASDISKEALAVAEKNGEKLGAEVQWAWSDLFSGIRESFDLIAANPPYIETEEIETLEPEVRDFEPRLALDGDRDGLSFYRRILSEAGEHLNPGGKLLVEIGAAGRDAVSRLFQEAGFNEIRVINDLAGKPRVVKGEKDV